MSHFNFWILAFFTIMSLFKNGHIWYYCLTANLPNCTIFGIFKLLLSTQDVNFPHNIFIDFQTLCPCSILSKQSKRIFRIFFLVLQIFFPSHFHLVYLCKLSKNGQVSFCSKAIIIFDEHMEDQAQNSLDETDNSCDCILSARFAVF